MSWNNKCSDWAVKWLFLTSVKSEQVSKTCSIVNLSSHPLHTGGSSPLNKKEWVIMEWPLCNRNITVSSFLNCFTFGNICVVYPSTHPTQLFGVVYYPRTHPTPTAVVLTYICLNDILSLRRGWVWMNENLYIAHKKLPHKTLRVHSARYTQCIHVSSRKLKLPKFNRDVTIEGILSSRVCRRINCNAHMAGDPDKDNLFTISGEIHKTIIVLKSVYRVVIF